MKLVLIRHGESAWTHEGKFTGWSDVDLSENGVEATKQAAEVLKDFHFTHIYTSALKRSKDTASILLRGHKEAGGEDLQVQSTWRLNERHYGALEGLNKKEASKNYGEEQVQRWRRGYHTRPPQVQKDDPRHPCHTETYLPHLEEIVPGESPADCFKRVKKWYECESPKWNDQAVVLVCAHGTSLRVLMQMIEGLSEEQVEKSEIPSSVPITYQLDRSRRLVDKHIHMDESAYRHKQQEIRCQSSI